MGLFNWLMHRNMKKEAERIAKLVKGWYVETKEKMPNAKEEEVIVGMGFNAEGLDNMSESSKQKTIACCATVNGFCYMMALVIGSFKGIMTFRALQFTAYMDKALEAEGFPPQSVEQKRKILETMGYAIDRWEDWTNTVR